jgi:hypothetical protein
MTVNELITILLKYPNDMPVTIHHDPVWVDEIESVTLDKENFLIINVPLDATS